MKFKVEIGIGDEMKLKVKNGQNIRAGEIVAEERIVEGVEVDKSILKKVVAVVSGKIIEENGIFIECDVEELPVVNIIGGGKWSDGVVPINSWQEVSEERIKDKLIMMDNPDNIVIAKCGALGAIGLIVKNSVKIESWMAVIQVDEPTFAKLKAEADDWGKTWIDEIDNRLLKVI